MVEEKASSVLKKSEFATLCYYLEEYCSKRMSFETFIAVLFDLLNTPDKVKYITRKNARSTIVVNFFSF